MKVRDIVGILNGEVLSGEDKLDEEVLLVGASDMMSDILALAKPGMLILTGHTSPQAIRTGLVTDLLGIVFVRGKNIPDETIELARENNFLVIKTNYLMYSSCGRLYEAGLRGIDERKD